MVIVKLISGLGNQLFQYALGRRLSMLNHTALKLDLSFYEKQNLRTYKLNQYSIQAEIATELDVQTLTRVDQKISSRVYRKLQKFLPHYRRAIFKERQWWIYEPDVWKAPINVYLDGYWQHYQYLELFQDQMRQDLTLKDDYSNIIGGVTQEICNNNSSVSLHIRRGDYITDKSASDLMGILPMEYYQNAVMELASRVRDPIFYVFSDDLNWVEANCKLPYPMVLVDVEGGKYDFLELELMSRCKHNIVANSSFSWWGAYLNRNPSKIVISPAQWCAVPDVNKNVFIQHPDWIKL